MANRERSTASNLYVKNFGKDFDESKLCELFSVYGTITSCKIPTDEHGQSKGFGYVNFERPQMANEAREKLNGHCLANGNRLYVGPFQRKADRQQELRRIHQENLIKRSENLCLYISNMDRSIDEKILEAIFSKFGQVTKTHVLRNGSESKGVGFVSFTTEEGTMRALNEMNGQWILSKPIYVRLSQGPNHVSTSQTIQQPYANFPPIVYVPPMVIPPPSYVQRFPLPLLPSSSTATRGHQLPYPYNRVKSED